MPVSASVAAYKAPTFIEFCSWDRQHAEQNKTYKLAADFAFTTLNALQLYRLFIVYDTIYRLTLLEAVRAHVGIDSARQIKGPFGEELDFLMESRYKHYKSFLTNEATPTFEYVVFNAVY